MSNTIADSRNTLLKTISFNQNSSRSPFLAEKRKKMKFARSQSEGEHKAIENALENV